MGRKGLHGNAGISSGANMMLFGVYSVSIHVCVKSPAADSWGPTRSNQPFRAFNNAFVCVTCVSSVSVDCF